LQSRWRNLAKTILAFVVINAGTFAIEAHGVTKNSDEATTDSYQHSYLFMQLYFLDLFSSNQDKNGSSTSKKKLVFAPAMQRGISGETPSPFLCYFGCLISFYRDDLVFNNLSCLTLQSWKCFLMFYIFDSKFKQLPTDEASDHNLTTFETNHNHLAIRLPMHNNINIRMWVVNWILEILVAICFPG